VLVGVGLIGPDVDGLLAETLNETKADRRLFDQKGGGMVPALEVHDLSFQRVERKAAMHYIKNVKNFLANQKNDSSRVVPGFGFTQSDVPADDDAIARLTGNLIIGREPLSLDDRAAGRIGLCWYWAENAIGPISRFNSISASAGSCCGVE
jgi:hypothetical protein